MTRPHNPWRAGALAFAALLVVGGSARAVDEYRYPRLHRAQEQLDRATDALNGDERPDSDYSGHRSRALELIRQAKYELDQAALYADSAQQAPSPDSNAYAGDSAQNSDYGADSSQQASEPTYDDPPSDWVPPPQPVVYYAAPPPPSPVGFWGHHPIPGGGWCLAEGPHLHDYEPEFYDQFQLVDGYFKFGEGMREWVYNGPHPIAGGGWCNIMGPHRHMYRPEVGFIFDPVRHGYYYDRERAVVIRTEVVHPSRDYHPPREAIEHYHHPQPLRPAPVGTPPPRVWEREHVLAQPHPAGRPMEAHPVQAQPGQPRPMNNPPNQNPFGVGQHQPVPARPEAHPELPPMFHQGTRENEHPAPAPAPQRPESPPNFHGPAPVAHPAPMLPPAQNHPAPAPAPVAHPAPAPAPAHPAPPAVHPAPARPLHPLKTDEKKKVEPQ